MKHVEDSGLAKDSVYGVNMLAAFFFEPLGDLPEMHHDLLTYESESGNSGLYHCESVLRHCIRASPLTINVIQWSGYQ